jgi:hypothetical protein
MKRTSLAILAVTAAAVAVPSVASAAQLNSLAFRSPTGNIACIGATANSPSLMCDREDTFTVTLNPTGEAQGRRVAGAIFSRSVPVLRYGQTWSRGNYLCTVSRSALVCASRRSARGFLFNNNTFRRIKL